MGQAAKLRRGALGLTQEELIEKMPEHQRIGIETLRRVEAGSRSTYHPGTLAAVSVALDWPADALWNEAHGEENAGAVHARLDEIDTRLSRVEETVDELLARVPPADEPAP